MKQVPVNFIDLVYKGAKVFKETNQYMRSVEPLNFPIKYVRHVLNTGEYACVDSVRGEVCEIKGTKHACPICIQGTHIEIQNHMYDTAFKYVRLSDESSDKAEILQAAEDFINSFSVDPFAD